jgi:hypothetical protein
LVISYEDGYLYTMGAILCFQFYLDIKIIKWQTKKLITINLKIFYNNQ